MKIFNCTDFPYDVLDAAPTAKGKRGNRKDKRHYSDLICTFDIETTNLDELEAAIMWHWQACVDGLVITGRTWEDFQTFLDGLDAHLPKDMCQVFYVHNLGYEFQFLRAIHDFTEDEVFCVTGRKVVKASIGTRFEFRCSYFLTNMSLRQFLKKMGIEHQKTEMDYSVIRYPWTPITEEELEYCVNDVLGLYEALKKSMQADGHSIANVPISSTGYVREDVKHAMNAAKLLKDVRACAPDWELYLALRRCFRGGNTHANRVYAEMIIPEVYSFDRASSYPDVLVNMPFPVKPFVRQDITKLEEIEPEMPYVLRIRFRNIRLTDEFDGCPYFSIHKCQELAGVINDNGRVISAKILSTYLTDIDLAIVISHYSFDFAEILESWQSEYGMLPAAIRDVIMEYYRKKTELKGVAGQEIYYDKAKAKLNSIYGLMAQNPLRTTLVFNGVDFSVKEVDEQEELQKANQKSFTVFAWGCWCTAWARYWLQRAIDLCGHKFIYCDTDSVKFVGDVDFNELNNEIRMQSEENHAYADDPAGNRHYLGVFEYEGKTDENGKLIPTYKNFATLGAKKYAYEDNNGKLHITIAGVSKTGADELGSLENFHDGFVFRENAGIEAYYNDTLREFDTGDWPQIVLDGHPFKITPNIYLTKGEYTLGMTLDYQDLIHLSQEDFDRMLKTL